MKNNRKILILIVCFILSVLTFIITPPYGLTIEQFRTITVIVVTLLLLIFEVFPVIITCLFSSILLYSFSCVESMNLALSGYTNHILYFTIASFGISYSLSVTTLPKKMLAKLISKSKKNINSVIICFMLCTAFLSAFISNIAAVLVFITFAFDFLKVYKDEDDAKKSKKTLLICITLASMIGGMMTPAGSSINLITLDIIYQKLGVTIPFVKWMMIGIPIALIMLFISYNICIKVYKPAQLKNNSIESYLKIIDKKEKLSFKEKYILIIVAIAIFLWILSSWFKDINITVVAIGTLVMLFIPKLNIITWDEFKEQINLPTFFVAGSMITLANTILSTGLDSVISSMLFPTQMTTNLVLVIAFVCLITFIFLIFVPVAPAAVGILIPAVIIFATNIGVEFPALIALACSLCASNCYLLPLDTVMIIPYSYKTFEMFELPKATFWIQGSMIMVVSIVISLFSLIIKI